MKNWLPSGKSLLIGITAIALAVWSLPDAPNQMPEHPNTPASQDRVGVIPTMAIPTTETAAQPQDKQKQPKQKTPPKNRKQAAPTKKWTPPQKRNSPKPNLGQTPKSPVKKPAPTPKTQVKPAPAERPPAPRIQPKAPPITPAPPVVPTPPVRATDPSNMFSPYIPEPTARLRIRVIDGRTQRPLPGAEVVIIETEQRLSTGEDGFTDWTDVPVLRNPRYRPMVAELHGQLGAIAYKNGYRDSVHLGIRMHDGIENETTIWMYKLGPGDTRIEPVLYQVPYHHIWLIELADKFRSKTQPGEGPERP